MLTEANSEWAPRWIANCCQCGRIVDTREQSEGGDAFGSELTDGRWTCSFECWDEAAVEPSSRTMIDVQNPIEELRLAALDAFPDLDCAVQFMSAPEEGPYGETLFPDDGTRPRVKVAVGIPMEAVIEVMAHELAHVAAGLEADHGPAWESAFERIHIAYCERMAARALLAEARDGN